MTSARDVIGKWLAVHWGVQHTVGDDELTDADTILAALDAAGFAIVPKNELKHWQCDGLFCDATNKPDDEDCWKCGLSRMNV